MIRQPTSFTEAYAWHAEAIRSGTVAVHDGLPECGFFRMRRVKGGPFVPVRVFIERETDPVTGELTAPEVYAAEVEGLRTDAAAIWSYLTPISHAAYLAMVERQRSEDDMAASMVPLDLSKKPTLPPRRAR